MIGNEFVLALLLDMSMRRMVSGGADVARVDFDDLKVDRIRSYKAPGFEVMLFQKASELANKYNLGLGDALNLLYAQGEAEFILTNDKYFCKRWKSNPSVEMETQIQVMKSVDFLNLCKRRNYL